MLAHTLYAQNPASRIAAILLAAALLIATAFYMAPVALAQTDTGTGTINPTPGASVDVNLPDTGSNVDTAPGGISSNTWLVLGIIVLVLAVMMVGWGMGSRTDRL